MPDRIKRVGNILVSAARAFQAAHWQPPVDAYQTPWGWLLKFELAGVLPAEVRVTVHGRQVSVSGSRRDVMVEEGQQSYCMEISYNQFERVVELPCDLSAMSTTTEYRDGMLIVRLKCRESGA
jgi:HSP20 family protein